MLCGGGGRGEGRSGAEGEGWREGRLANETDNRKISDKHRKVRISAQNK